MSTFADYYVREAIETTRAKIVGYLQAAGLILTNFTDISPERQFAEAMAQSANNASALTSQLVRGRGSLDTATDPGDDDPYDPTNVNATPASGFLSEMGAGNWGTPRIDEGFANGVVTITNNTGSALNIAPEQVTFSKTGSPEITYRNSASASIYTNPNGTVTIANGSSLDVPLVAEQKGTASNASAGQIVLVTSLGTGVTVNNAASIAAQTREPADAYRNRCRAAPAIISPNGPGDAYLTIATRAFVTDAGEVLFIPPWGDGSTGIGVDANGFPIEVPNARGTSLGITRVYVSKSSSTGVVTIYGAGTGGGAAISGSIANLTALLNAVYWPEATTRSINAATDVTINIVGTIYAKPGAGVSSGVLTAGADAALTAAFPGYDIGGFNQTAGAGTIYKQELEATANASHPNIYKVTLATPAGDTALALGQDAILGTTSWTVVIA